MDELIKNISELLPLDDDYLDQVISDVRDFVYTEVEEERRELYFKQLASEIKKVYDDFERPKTIVDIIFEAKNRLRAIDYSKPDDLVVLKMIKDIKASVYETDEELSAHLNFLTRYYPDISDVIFYPKKPLHTDQEVLDEAKRLAKPICL